MIISKGCDKCDHRSTKFSEEPCKSCDGSFSNFRTPYPELHDVPKAADRQIGGDHYKTLKIQPMAFSIANNLNAYQHTVVKYTVRKKGDKAKRLQDIDKAIHCLQMYRDDIEAGLCE